MATTNAVVSASILILTFNYFIHRGVFRPMTPAKIALHGVNKAFGAKKVLQGVDLEVAPGESMVVIGGSGTASPSC